MELKHGGQFNLRSGSTQLTVLAWLINLGTSHTCIWGHHVLCFRGPDISSNMKNELERGNVLVWSSHCFQRKLSILATDTTYTGAWRTLGLADFLKCRAYIHCCMVQLLLWSMLIFAVLGSLTRNPHVSILLCPS